MCEGGGERGRECVRKGGRECLRKGVCEGGREGGREGHCFSHVQFSHFYQLTLTSGST